MSRGAQCCISVERDARHPHGLGPQLALAGQEFVGEARTVPGFRLFDLGGFPGLVPVKADRDGVAGEIWAVDDVVYGPVDLPTIVEWVKDERVLGETWVFVEARDAWQKASQVAELAPYFYQVSGDGTRPAQVGPLIAGIKPGQLRRVKILSEMTDQQLGRFAQ